jgi:hypothetical protein
VVDVLFPSFSIGKLHFLAQGCFPVGGQTLVNLVEEGCD